MTVLPLTIPAMPRMFAPVRMLDEWTDVTHGTHGIVVAIEPLIVFDRSFMRVVFPKHEDVALDLTEPVGQLCAMRWLAERAGNFDTRGPSLGLSWTELERGRWELRAGSASVVFDVTADKPEDALCLACLSVVAVPTLAMRPPTALDLRVLAVQARHDGYCECRCCRGTASLADVQSAESELGIKKKGPKR